MCVPPFLLSALLSVFCLSDALPIIDFVGYWPDQKAVVVAHEGTDPTRLSVPVFSLPYCKHASRLLVSDSAPRTTWLLMLLAMTFAACRS